MFYCIVSMYKVWTNLLTCLAWVWRELNSLIIHWNCSGHHVMKCLIMLEKEIHRCKPNKYPLLNLVCWFLFLIHRFLFFKMKSFANYNLV